MRLKFEKIQAKGLTNECRLLILQSICFFACVCICVKFWTKNLQKPRKSFSEQEIISLVAETKQKTGDFLQVINIKNKKCIQPMVNTY